MADILPLSGSSPAADRRDGGQQHDNEVTASDGDPGITSDVMEVSGPRRLGVRMIADGDTVIVVESKTSLKAVKVAAGQSFQNRRVRAEVRGEVWAEVEVARQKLSGC